MVKSYNQFVENKYLRDSLFNEFFYMFLESDIINESERRDIMLFVEGNSLITENFFDTLKTRYDNAVTVVKNFPDNAKNALNTIIDASKTALDFVTNIIKRMRGYASSILTKNKDEIVAKMKADPKMMEQLKAVVSKDKNAFAQEVKNIGIVADFYKTKFVNALLEKIRNAFTEVLSGKLQPVAESLEYMKAYNENAEVSDMGKNVIASLVHKIESIPPFSWLHSLKHAAEQGISKVVEALNVINTNLGGPKLEIPLTVGVLAIGLEYATKTFVAHTILDFAIPFVGVFVSAVSYTAMILAFREICLTLTATTDNAPATHTQTPPVAKPTPTPTPAPTPAV